MPHVRMNDGTKVNNGAEALRRSGPEGMLCMGML